MNIQRAIDLVGAALPIVAAAAGLFPGVAEAENAIAIVEDGIRIEEEFYTWFESPAGLQARQNLAKLFGDLGITVAFGAGGQIAIVAADFNSPVRKATDESPYSGNLMGTGDHE